MSNEKGGLIKKRKSPLMPAPATVKKTQGEDFSYSEPVKKAEPPVNVQQPIEPETQQKPSSHIGKKNSTKSFKVPSTVHTEIQLLGSFMDENKAYLILQKLIDSYVKNELTNRQQHQFEFMLEALTEEK